MKSLTSTPARQNFVTEIITQTTADNSNTGGISSGCHRGGSVSIPGQSIWDLWGERGTGSGFFRVLQFCPFSITPKNPNPRVAFICHPRFVLERGEIRPLTYKLVYCACLCCLVLSVNKWRSPQIRTFQFYTVNPTATMTSLMGAGSDISAT